MVRACRVVVMPARGIGEGEVGIVNLLELLGSGGTFWGIGGNTVRMGL